MIRAYSPKPAQHISFRLQPDSESDPYVFRIDLSKLGLGTGRVIFSREPGVGTTAVHLDFGPLSFQKRPATKNPRLWVAGAFGALAVAGAAAVVGRRAKRMRRIRRSA